MDAHQTSAEDASQVCWTFTDFPSSDQSWKVEKIKGQKYTLVSLFR